MVARSSRVARSTAGRGISHEVPRLFCPLEQIRETNPGERRYKVARGRVEGIPCQVGRGEGTDRFRACVGCPRGARGAPGGGTHRGATGDAPGRWGRREYGVPQVLLEQGEVACTCEPLALAAPG